MDSNIKNTSEYQREFRRAAEIAVNKALEELKGRAVEKAPQSKSRKDDDNAPSSLKQSGAVTKADWKGNRLKGDVHFGLVYAEVQERGGWVSGPLKGKKIKHYSTRNTGPHYLKGSLDDMQADYTGYVIRRMRERLR